jgi:trehalose 6-phosphate synthase
MWEVYRVWQFGFDSGLIGKRWPQPPTAAEFGFHAPKSNPPPAVLHRRARPNWTVYCCIREPDENHPCEVTLPNGSRVGKERLVAAAGLLALALIFGALVALLDGLVRSWTDRDVERRASLVWRALEPDIERTDETTLLQRLDSLASDDRVVGILVCYGRGARELANGTLPETIGCRSSLVRGAIAAEGSAISGRDGKTQIQLTAHRFGQYRENAVVVVHDRGFVSGRRRGLLRMLLFGGLALLLLTWMTLRYGTQTARQSISTSIRELVQQIGRGERPHTVPDDLQPIAEDLGATVKKLRQQRPVADETTGPERLRHYVEQHMPNTSLVLVANREPYVHERESGEIRVKQPPSGLVTGVEPLLRACGGTWVAHGAGSADRETSDARGRVAVPPDAPEYVLRRVWLTEREEEGYYYGFSNEGLWPLCHIAHTRPTFRADDWQDYVTVNRRFAATAVEESGDHGLILAQDYHFALVPRFVRELAPSTVINLFWHIPWPNPEVVGICPWRKELLDGMLGADVIGFHTRYHCLNFLETLQRSIECRVDHSTMSVEYQGRRTMVKEYPISITWPYPAAPRTAGRLLRRQFGIADSAHVTIGVDRADYTKGLLERIAAVELLLETNPALIGKFVLVQLAAPSRTHIKK